MFERLRLLTTLLTIAVLTWASPARATSESDFVRIDTDELGHPRALQLSVTTYVRTGVSVDLISAIHIGDRSYYANLNETFKGYDALLYEMVAPEGIDIAKAVDGRKGLISTAQVSLANLLNLSFQLEEIEYGQSNFVHADLTPAELRQSMADRDESLYVYFWRIVFAAVEQYAQDPLGIRNWERLSSAVNSREPVPFKTILAYELTNLDSLRDILGEDSSSAVVGARNERAIEVLREQIDTGARRIGIFFGVAHMPDLEIRLLNEIDLVYEKTAWLDSWQLNNAEHIE